jgi:hypothetical protein
MAVEKRQRSSRQKRIIAFVTVFLAVAVSMAIFEHNAHMFNIIGAFGGMIVAAMAFTTAHKSAAKALAKYEGIEGVSPLLEALEIPDKDVHRSVTECLTRVLPKMHASDSDLLTADARKVLRKQLAATPKSDDRYKSDQFVEATLKALEQVGDESFIEWVERLAEGGGYGNSFTVREAAKECLPALRQRAENDRLSHDLLRASAATASRDPDELLRAAESAGATDSSALLRASGADS